MAMFELRRHEYIQALRRIKNDGERKREGVSANIHNMPLVGIANVLKDHFSGIKLLFGFSFGMTFSFFGKSGEGNRGKQGYKSGCEQGFERKFLEVIHRVFSKSG